MSESLTQTGGPSLEQILWRAMDRWEERPALVDSEEFADHIADAFEGDVAAEEWVARFFDGAEKLHKAPADMAEAIVRATKERLHVYEFDVKRLEYVIVEDEEKVVVVSEFGQFALQNNDMVTRAIEAAVIPAGQPGATSTRGSAGALDRGGAQPKAYFVRASGEVVAVDVKKVARSLEKLLVQQVSMPAVSKPGARLLPFAPARRALTEAREARALRQDARARQAVPPPPRLERTRATDVPAAAAPPGAQTALFLLMPDGTLARPEMGSATRWQQMVGNYARAASAAVPVTAGQRITVQAGNVVAIINMGGHTGTVGERALARSENLSAVRADAAPVRVLGDDDLAKAVAAGAMVVPGFARADKFWIQPESAFKPDEKALAQGGLGAGKPAVVGQPLQLGEITGDPWSDWALTGGGEMTPEMMTALRGRTRHALRAALSEAGGDDLSIPPEMVAQVRGKRGKELMLAGGRVVGFRAPDGSVVVQRADGPIRLAALDRPGLAPIDLQLPGTSAPLAVRSGAIPATALAALQMALEQTANAGGYRLPMMHIESARDALEVGAAMDLSSFDARRTQVRLAGPSSIYDSGSGQVAQLVLSMPFPNEGELHVGSDLSEALQAYLAAQVQPSGGSPFGALAIGGGAGAGASALALRLRDSGGDGMPLDWGGLHTQAIGRAQDALVTLDLPMVQPLVAGSANVSGLPLLLQRALAQSGDWTPGPGAAVPISIREFALKGPFTLAEGALPDLAAAMPQTRPLNPGEEEIVIPMPLWAQMGRGQLSATDQIMASPLAPSGYAPPMGVYRLVVPAGGPIDMTGGAPPGTEGIVELTGPTGLELVVRPNESGVWASSLGGKQILGRVALDDGETVVTRRGRIRVGAPLSDKPGQKPYVPPESANAPTASEFQPTDTVLSQGGGMPESAPTVVSGAPPPSMPNVDVPSGTFIDGTYSGAGAASSAGSAGGGQMAGALSSAMQMSNDVAGRTTMPGRPRIGQGSTSSSSPITSDSSGFASRAKAAGQQSAGPQPVSSSPTQVSSSAGTASGSSPTVSGAGTLDSSGGSDQTLVATAVEGSVTGVQAGSAIADMTSASSGARRAAEQSGSSAAGTFITGLQPGMWSGHRRSDTFGYQGWTYSSETEDRPRSAGGVDLSSLSRPVYPSLPTSLRFRYVGAPLWWSGGRGGGIGGSGDEAEESDSSPSTRAMRAGLRAATSAASIWRSILVASPQWGGPSDDLSGGMDAGHDSNAAEMSSLSRRFDALTSASLVAAGGAAGAGAAYVGVNSSGAAGTLSRGAAGRARADSVEMSIVAAIPPAPPPLESMGSGPTGGEAPHARHKHHKHKGGGGNEHKEGADAVSHSKIEGSVDAIAQRIYHRIRRRIQSDRERFGG